MPRAAGSALKAISSLRPRTSVTAGPAAGAPVPVAVPPGAEAVPDAGAVLGDGVDGEPVAK